MIKLMIRLMIRLIRDREHYARSTNSSLTIAHRRFHCRKRLLRHLCWQVMFLQRLRRR